jgi:MoCo/4Fe-4S cofactor protein with predicted Tat translocation signal
MSMHSRKTSGQDLDLSALRAKLDGQTGPRFWRGLEELADTEAFRQYIQREFPEQASEWTDPSSRRNFLRLMGASLALAGVGLGVSGCDYATAPLEKIVPYVKQPENIVPGKPLRYATAVSLGGFATGVLAESHTGRPTMLEGNELHPDSLGSIDPLSQASLLALYDPDRSQVILRRRGISTFEAFLLAAVTALEPHRKGKGTGTGARVRILTETVTSPTLARQIRALQTDFPEAKWHQYEPVAPHAARAGAKWAFGRDATPQYHVAEADVILALDSDFLAAGPGFLRHARAYAARRQPEGMNRLYAVEPTVSVTGSSADHRFRMRAQEVPALAYTLAHRLGVAGVPEPPKLAAESAGWVDALVKDLGAHHGSSLVIVGDGQPSYVHSLAHAINETLGNVGKTVVYTEPVEAEPVDQVASITDLCREMKAGDVLFILGGNPAYTVPPDLGFAEGLAKVGFKARLGLYEDETSALCDWHVPEAHELETWGDVRGSDGTATIQQPLIAPLFGGRSAVELLASLLKHPERSGYEVVRSTWRARAPKGQDFETFWQKALHDGVVPETRAKTVQVTVKADLNLGSVGSATSDLEVVFRPDPTIWDGRFANNGWLQELPKPLTKIVWDNAALLSPQTAKQLRVSVSETTRGHNLIELNVNGRTVEAPVFILPGQADGSITLHLGYGRLKTGRVGTGAGFDAGRLRTSDAMLFVPGVDVKPTGRSTRLATTQMHHSLEGRDLYREGTVGEYQKTPDFARHHPHAHAETPAPDQTLIPKEAPDFKPGANDYQWAMVIDLNACTGCSACVLACVAENNIPVVGKSEVLNSREMHWIEVDRYFDGTVDEPQVYHQPRTCMHCEKAPCEVVCPVAATLHDHEGLNLMVYNRCVGTRYCANNCPYKVRRFNFFQYADLKNSSLALLNNPDVTVRARGVMEKCTYCVQRINEARYTAELDGNRRIKDGEVTPACAAACPTRAIVFGNQSDPDAAVSRLKTDPRRYDMLAELNVRPRTSYLAKLRNPNPDIQGETTEP